MPSAPAYYPDPVTIAYLIERKLKLGVHCHKCANYVRMDPERFPPDTVVPSMRGFRCTRCGWRECEARPDYPPGSRLG